MKEEEKEKAPPHPHAHGATAAAAAAPPLRARLGDEHGSASVYRVGALEKAIAGFAQRETEAVVNPTVGSSFFSLDEAYEFYNIYSWEYAFGVRYGASSMDSHGTKCIQQFVCACEGKPTKDSNSFHRCECTASILLLRSRDDGWHACEHQVGHNHPLSKMCAQRSSWQSHSSIDKNTRGLIRQLRENNVPHISDIDGKNPLSDDLKKALETFARIKAKDPTFDYTGLQLDSNCRVRPLVWTSGQRLQYQYFGDVIIFDTTYRSDKYGTPFGLFVGVNNNFETILLGGVLMINEKMESYKWVLSQFFQLMGGEHPKTILTDCCEAIEEAVLEVLPSTTHRWWKWNVLGRAKDYLGFHYTKTSSFGVGLHKILNDMLTADEFERAWEMLLEEHGLENHPFLKEIYEVRHKWVKAYFSDTFCATLTSTQKSDCAKHFLKQHHVPRDCSMQLFAEQYEKL
ncbi:protein FAR1-RELATED SEQUENCE 5 [Triticum aestivum]|uniref:protein FAR1-RELATED SEQUENCE 5 n=1 Tax=Triticum aestivum TaxID=4565 RepID=UPI001D004456|nr:protein FAR1-RELATED SEQUENCE 5-like [Triticum aestivum]